MLGRAYQLPPAPAQQVAQAKFHAGCHGDRFRFMSEVPWSGEPAFRVARPVMTQRWMTLSAIHWRVPAAAIQSTLPADLVADEFDGSGWVGLIPFHMEDIAPGTGPSIPYLGTFPETNVRTYVTGPAGPGVWFHSLDINRLLPVITAWVTYKLPYIWSKMSITRNGNLIIYRARRRWPGPRGARSDIAVEIGDPVASPSQLDHFLSARWGLYTMLRRRLAFAKVEHEPWPLHAARIDSLEDELMAAGGFPVVGAPDHVAYSPGVAVRIEIPRFV